MGKREGRRGEWEETTWAYWEGSLMWAVFQPPLGHTRIGLGPGTLPHPGVFTACAGLTTLCGNTLPCLASGCTPLFCWKARVHCSMCPLRREDEVLRPVAPEGSVQAIDRASAEEWLLAMWDWCPLPQLILLHLFSQSKQLSEWYLAPFCFNHWRSHYLDIDPDPKCCFL